MKLISLFNDIQSCVYYDIGEDRVSLERHAKVLLEESKKRRPNSQVVEDLMSRTFPMRAQGHIGKCV